MATQDNNILNKKLFDHTRKGEWDEVVKIYAGAPHKASFAQITKMKDTALHIAVATGKTKIALQILDAIQNTERLEDIVNEEGNTPLHLAARQGDTQVCQKVKDMKVHTIATVRNKKGESAIFLAARHDKERAFLILHSILGQDEYLLRRLNGDTVFHVALANEYFRMAMRILKMHPNLADLTNEKGVTPLHILAAKPNAFRSSTPLGYFDTLLYHCLVVDIELEDVETNSVKEISIEEIAKGYPENYHTCVFFVVNLFHFIMYCVFEKRKKNDKADDVENPNKKSDHIQPTGFDGSSTTTIDGDVEPKPGTTTDQGEKKEKVYAWVLFFKSLVKILLLIVPGIVYRIFEKRTKNDKAGDVENPNKKSDHIQPTGFDGSSSTTVRGDVAPKPEKLDGSSSTMIGGDAKPKPEKLDVSSSTMIGSDAKPKPEKLDASSSTMIGSDAKPKPEATTDQDSNIIDKKTKKESYPSTYASWVLFFKTLVKILLVVLGIGIWRIKEIKKKKQKHIRAKAIMNELVKNNMTYAAGAKPSDDEHYDPKFTDDLPNPTLPDPDNINDDLPNPNLPYTNNTNDDLPNPNLPDTNNTNSSTKSKDDVPNPNNTSSPKKPICSPILIAAKTGAKEMVEKILKEFPVAIYDLDEDQKNVVLLAIENRQPQVYKFLLNLNDIPKESIFGQLDVNGNSALHLAANQCDDHRPWLIPGSALQMQWEIKWYQFVRTSMPPDFFAQSNNEQKTPKRIFLDSHKDLIKEGSEWLSKTSESCSVVAALVATVAFATSATVPGGIHQEKGTPTLGDKPEFNAFAIASLVALCFSVTALVFFLSILTSRYQEKDFAQDLPRKLLLGLTSLFSSIVAMLVSFCAGHVFILKYDLRYVAYPLYAALCFPISFFALAQLSLYFDLMMAIFNKVPQRSYDSSQH